MCHSIARRVVFAVCFVGCAWRLPAAEEPPKPSPVNLAFVPADSFGVLVIQPSRLMAAPELKMFPVEVAAAAMQKEIGLDPANIEQVVIVFENLFQPRPPEPGVIFHLSQAIQPKELFPRVMSQATEATSGGKKYFKSNRAGLPSIHFADNKTIVVAQEEILIRMMAAAPLATSPLHQLAKKIDPSAQVAAVFSLDAVREPMNQMLAQAPPLPPPVAELAKLLQLSSVIEYRGSLNGSLKNEIVFRTKDEKSATNVERVAKQGLAFGRQVAETQIEREFARQQDDTLKRAFRQYALRMISQISESIKVNTKGTDVTISTEQNLALSSIGAGGALLIPATIAARDAARRSVSMNNMRQMGIAFKSYENLFHRYPARAIYSKDRKPLLSWRVAMLLFIGEDELYKQFNLDEPWDSEHNKKLIAKMPNIYQSPHDSNNEGKTCYLVPVGKGTMFEKTTGVKPAEITDGESNTIMLVEVAPEKSVVWTKPEDLDYDPEKPLRGFGSLDHGFFNAGFVDVSVRRIHSAMDPDFLKAMFTQAGGEKIGNTDGN